MSPIQYPVYTLQSNIGQQWLNQASTKNQPIIDQYSNYGETPSLSGPIALLTLFNAISVAYRIRMSESKSDKEFQELKNQLYAGHKVKIDIDEILKYQDKYIVQEKKIKDDTSSSSEHQRRQRMTLLQLEKLAVRLGFGTFLKFTSPTTPTTTAAVSENKKLNEFTKTDHLVMRSFQTANQFKIFLCQKLNVRVSGIVANYDRSIIFKNNNINNSNDNAKTKDNNNSNDNSNNDNAKTKDDISIVYGLVAACHGDHILVLDGGAQGPVWVHIERLFEAMSAIDKQSGLPMGTLSIYELM